MKGSKKAHHFTALCTLSWCQSLCSQLFLSGFILVNLGGPSPSFKLHFVNKNSRICAKTTLQPSAITTLNYLICGYLGTSCLFEHWSVSVHLVFLLILNICSAFLMSVNIVLDNSVRTIGLPQRKYLGFLIRVSSKDGEKPALNKSWKGVFQRKAVFHILSQWLDFVYSQTILDQWQTPKEFWDLTYCLTISSFNTFL